MARNGSGVFSIPNTMVPGTTITAASHNENYSDIASEITNSVAADGQTTMTGVLKVPNGSAASPSVTFGTDLDTGLYRAVANELSGAAGGAQIWKASSTGFDITTGTLKIGGSTMFPVSYANIQDISATKRVLGRNTADAGDIEEVTAAQLLEWIGTPAQGDIFYRNGTETARLPAGTVGQFLTTGGEDANPSWASGGWTLLNTLTASSSSSLSDTTTFTSAYSEYEIRWSDIVLATDANNRLLLRVHTGGSFQTSGYLSTTLSVTGSGTVVGGADATVIDLSTSISAGAQNSIGMTGHLRVAGVTGTSAPKMWFGRGSRVSGVPSLTICEIAGAWNGGNGALTGFQIFTSVGNITSGTVKIYGRL